MELGGFSVSLAVKDIAVSRAFYEKLGFKVTCGVQEQKWLILVNGSTAIGLFEGMFEKNCLTFNPGWDLGNPIDGEFLDVRRIRERLEADGIEMTGGNTQESDSGPAHISFLDPDGNPILIDQHR